MLGEDHSLIKEFPELSALISTLSVSDETFSIDCQRYNALDAEIRELELSNAPIGDDEMHNLKHNRSVLKDLLYKRLMEEK